MSYSNTKRRVVVTGLGLLTPLGLNLNENWLNLLNGKSAISALTSDGLKKIIKKIVFFMPCHYRVQRFPLSNCRHN